MPFSDLASYPRTGRDFSGHWGPVNAFLTSKNEDPIVLVGDFTKADLDLLVTDVETSIATVNTRLDVLKQAENLVPILQKPLALRVKQLRRAFEAYLGGTKYAGVLPLTPNVNGSAADWERTLSSVAQTWAAVNGDATLTDVRRPILLAGGYTQAQFVTDSAAMVGSLRAVESLHIEIDPKVNARDALMANLKTRCIQYRGAAQSSLLPTDDLFKTLPVAVGNKPAPEGAVRLRVKYQAGSDVATLVWRAAPNIVSSFKVMICFGPRWKAADAHHLADLPSTAVTYTTPAASIQPGTTWLRVVSVMNNNTKVNSNSVKVVS